MGIRVIVAVSSDIGVALAQRWLAQGHRIVGTYRTAAPALRELEAQGVELVRCDLSDRAAVREACAALARLANGWEVLVLAPGSQEPVGAFIDCDFDEWQDSVAVNFSAQMRFVHAMLPARGRDVRNGPMVLMFAGGGTNNATVCYSAYTISKIAQIKMCELLDAEIADTRFAILGPGWVKTKIHEATLRAGNRAGANYQRTHEMLAGGDCVPMGRVVECCDWMIAQEREVIGGRNISVVYDQWRSPELARMLRADPHMYRLRRNGNERLVGNG